MGKVSEKELTVKDFQQFRSLRRVYRSYFFGFISYGANMAYVSNGQFMSSGICGNCCGISYKAGSGFCEHLLFQDSCIFDDARGKEVED